MRLDRQSEAIEKRMKREGHEKVLKTLVTCVRKVVGDMTVPGAPEAIAGDPREASESTELWTVFVPNLPSERSASSDSKHRETLMMKLRKDKSAPVESET